MTAWTHLQRLWWCFLFFLFQLRRSQYFSFACQVHESLCVWYKELLFRLSNIIQWCLGGSFECDHCGVDPLHWKWKTGFSLAFNYITALRNNNLFLGEINWKVSRHIYSYIAYIKIRITLWFYIFNIFFQTQYQSFVDTLYSRVYHVRKNGIVIILPAVRICLVNSLMYIRWK